MNKDENEEANQLVNTDTKVTAVFVISGVVLWYASTTVTESQPIQFAILLGVGLIAPTLLNELRKESRTKSC